MALKGEFGNGVRWSCPRQLQAQLVFGTFCTAVSSERLVVVIDKEFACSFRGRIDSLIFFLLLDFFRFTVGHILGFLVLLGPDE